MDLYALVAPEYLGQYKQFLDHYGRIETWKRTSALLDWDMLTYMPEAAAFSNQ